MVCPSTGEEIPILPAYALFLCNWLVRQVHWFVIKIGQGDNYMVVAALVDKNSKSDSWNAISKREAKWDSGALGLFQNLMGLAQAEIKTNSELLGDSLSHITLKRQQFGILVCMKFINQL